MGPDGQHLPGPRPSDFHLAVAAAVDGDRDALSRLLEERNIEEWARFHRMGPALFCAARDAGFEGPAVEFFDALYLATAAQWVRLSSTLAQVGSGLDAADVPWIPFKGLDTADRFFPQPELRLSSDLDVLVPVDQLDRAVEVLSEAGWDFRSTPFLADYQRVEGYARQARGSHGVGLELHYRLWGMVPQSLVEACWISAIAAPDLGRSACRLSTPTALIVSAVHSWIHTKQTQFIYWWELKLIADQLSGPDEVAAVAREHGLQLPVGLAVRFVGALWQQEVCLELGRMLLDDLRWPERAALDRVHRRGIEALTLEVLTLSRLFARRPSRMGWKSLYRRVWPHAGTVEDSTPADLAWWRRRLKATAENLGLTRGG